MKNNLDLWASFTSDESNDNTPNDTITQPKHETPGERRFTPLKQMPGESIDSYIERAFESIAIKLENRISDNRRPIEED